VWDAATGKVITRLRPNALTSQTAALSADGTVAIQAAALSPDGTRAVTGGAIGRIWDTASGKLVASFDSQGMIDYVAFSPDGTKVMSVGSTVRMWDAGTGKKLGPLEQGGVVSVAEFSGDGARVVTATSDGIAWISDAATRKELAQLSHSPNETVFRAAFSPDRRTVVTTAGQAARLWRIFPSTQELVDAAKARARRCLTLAQRKAYFLPEAPPHWCVERRVWPYQSTFWQEWLVARKNGGDPPLPKW
jgi:WD40 repeat protein